MALDILAFAAHRDDTEITCGGLLARMVEKGYTPKQVRLLVEWYLRVRKSS